MSFVPQNFVDKVGPVVSAAWLNGVDVTVNGVFQGATTVAQAQAILGITTPVSFPITISQGGTGQITAAAALAALGGIGAAAVPGLVTAGVIGAALYPRTAAEVGAAVTPVNLQYVPGQLDRYLTNANPGTTAMDAALVASIAQAQQVDGASVLIAGTYKLAANNTVPYGVSMQVLDTGSFVIGAVLTIQGAFSAPKVTVFPLASVSTSSPVLLAPGSVLEAYPEWWGARGDSTLSVPGTACDASIASCIQACSTGGSLTGVGVIPIRFGSGYYLTANQIFPAATTMRGAGRKSSGFIASAGTTGVWWQDSGNAAGVIIEDLAWYGNSASCPAMTYIMRLGQNTTQHGSEGYIRGCWFRDCACAGGGYHLDINANVGFYSLISVYGPTSAPSGASLIRSQGAQNMWSQIVANGAGANAYSFWTGISYVHGLEIEAPGNCSSSFAPLHIDQNAFIYGCTMSIAAGSTFDHLAEIGAGAFVGELDIQYFNGGGTATVSGGNIQNLGNNQYYGGSVTGTAVSRGSGPYSWGKGNLLAGLFTGLSAVTTQAVTLPWGQSVSTYRPHITLYAANTGWWITSQTANGFTINFNSAYTGDLKWEAVQ